MPVEDDNLMDPAVMSRIQDLGNYVIGGWGSDVPTNVENSANSVGALLAAYHSALLYSTPEPNRKKAQQIFRKVYFQILSAYLDKIEQHIDSEYR